MKRYTIGKIFPFFCIPLIINLCDVCKQKPIQPNSWQVLLYNIYDEDDPYNNILIYREKTTNYLFLRPLQKALLPEIAIELLQLFLTFGVPNHLDFSFENNMAPDGPTVMNKIKTMHPSCENVNCDFEGTKAENGAEFQRISTAISKMLERRDGKRWVLDCQITQYKLNLSRTIIFNHSGKFLSTCIPFEIFMRRKANVNNYIHDNNINPFEWDLFNQNLNTVRK